MVVIEMMNYKVIAGGFHGKSFANRDNNQKICEDYHIIKEKLDEKFYTFAVADGAGSAHYASMGAKVVCQNICDLLYENFEQFYDSDAISVKRKIINHLRSKLQIEAKKMNSRIEEFASTLLFISIKGSNIIAGHIGDGMIIYKNNNNIELLSHPENGEFSNLTYFVTSKYYLHHLRLYKGTIANIQNIYLMTDGMANIFYSKKHKKILDSFIFVLNELQTSNSKELNSSIQRLIENNISKRTNDDSTLVVACIQPE